MADNKGIPEGKKRYAITLTMEHVNRFRKLSADLGLSPSMMSRALDEALESITGSMEQFKARHAASGKLTLGDLFEVVGQQLNEKEEESEEREEETCPDCGRPMHRFHHCELNPVANPQPKRPKRQKRDTVPK